jgi:hypothetical protein
MSQRDWRLPENRREAFQRFYSFHLKYKSHPGCVYALLPAIAEAMELDDDQRAWLVWLNGNTQNVVTSLMLLEAAPRARDWKKAVDFWNEHFTKLEWDTDRRHQKNRFGEATEDWYINHAWQAERSWRTAGSFGWQRVWDYAFAQPHMGRLSSWSMIEYARILLGPVIPDADTWLLNDKSGSKSHRNGLAVVKGYDATYWDADAPFILGIVDELADFGDDLLREAEARNAKPGPEVQWHPDVGRLTMESALCTYKSWHKPNRRYPNVYSDMMYNRIKKAEARFGRRFDILWDARKKHLPEYLRLEDMPLDPGLCAAKQNHYLETGQIPVMWKDADMPPSDFDMAVVRGRFGTRKDPKW